MRQNRFFLTASLLALEAIMGTSEIAVAHRLRANDLVQNVVRGDEVFAKSNFPPTLDSAFTHFSLDIYHPLARVNCERLIVQVRRSVRYEPFRFQCISRFALAESPGFLRIWKPSQELLLEAPRCFFCDGGLT
ncbi:MAG: hypothetical protein ACLQBK_22705, partial [Candidatus Sulfotelmatobacter sp.]